MAHKYVNKIPELSQKSIDKINDRFVEECGAGNSDGLVRAFYAIWIALDEAYEYIPCDLYDDLFFTKYNLGKRLLRRIAREKKNGQ